MSTYKEPLEYIQLSLESILGQTYIELEFVIIVDAPDNEELISYLKERALGDSRIKISINEKNCGLTESLNRAIRLASGEYIARMDADDISEPERLESQLNYLIKYGLDLVGCNIRDIDEMGNIINPNGTDYPTTDGAIKEYLKTNSAIPHPTWFCKRTVYEEFQYIDFPSCEDYEFLTRIALNGLKLGNVKEPMLRYRINSKGISASKKVQQKTSQYFVRRNYNAGRISGLVEFINFVNSREGKKKQSSLTQYYEQSAKLKEYWVNGNNLRFILSGLKTVASKKEARNVIFCIYKEKRLKKKYGNNY